MLCRLSKYLVRIERRPSCFGLQPHQPLRVERVGQTHLAAINPINLKILYVFSYCVYDELQIVVNQENSNSCEVLVNQIGKFLPL